MQIYPSPNLRLRTALAPLANELVQGLRGVLSPRPRLTAKQWAGLNPGAHKLHKFACGNFTRRVSRTHRIGIRQHARNKAQPSIGLIWRASLRASCLTVDGETTPRPEQPAFVERGSVAERDPSIGGFDGVKPYIGSSPVREPPGLPTHQRHFAAKMVPACLEQLCMSGDPQHNQGQ